MNTSFIKIGAAFILGAASGGTCVYFTLKKRFDEELIKDINECRSVARKRVQEAQELVTSKTDAETAAAYNERVESDVYFNDYTKYYRGSNIKENLNVLSSKINDSDFDVHMAERENPEDDEETSYDEILSDSYILAMEQAKRDNIAPYQIDEESFNETCQWHDKIELIYYAGDDKLADERDDEINDEEAVSMMGENWTRYFDDEIDVIYIRNDQRGTDYIVAKVLENFVKETGDSDPVIIIN